MEPLWRVAEDARPFDLLGLGQISLDRVARVASLPAPGGKALLEAVHELPGGQVATALLAAARLGLRCALAGTVGDDPAGAQALGPLVRAGVDVDRVARVAGAPTRQAWVLVEREGGERTVLERRSAALRMPAGSVASLAPACGRVLLVDLEHPDASREVAARARRDGIPVVLDADRATPAALLLAREVDFPIVSRGFAEEFSSDASLEDGLRGLCGPQTRMAVVTCGERGSVARLGDRVLRTPATRVEVRDTTGAGDVFRGAFAWALVRGLDADRVLRVANAAAAFSCRGEGAQGALPESSELESGLQGGGRWQA